MAKDKFNNAVSYFGFKEFFTLKDCNDIKKLVFSQFSKRYLSDMIIDYHFEEYPYNVFLDIKELLLFQEKTDKKLPQEKIDLYKRILQIDFLPYEEVIKLHEELKKRNMKEEFYDDMLFARNIVGKAIKESILTKEKLSKYLNKQKSEEYGVDVYELDGEEFFALVKSGEHYHHAEPYGYSFSLVGTDAVGVYGNESFGNTFVYDGINENQIIHIFPTDSYTHYEDGRSSTKRVNSLLNPNDLLKNTSSFNEILLKEKGSIETEMDSKIPTLRKIAVYCFNNINDKHLVSAKENDIGILLINTSKYSNEYATSARSEFRGFNLGDYNYFEGMDIVIGTFEENRDRFTKI